MKVPWASKSKEERPRRRLAGDEQLQSERAAEQRGQVLFRRNRTLTGSLSPKVGSANELDGDLRSSRSHVHHLNAHRRRLITILSFVVAATVVTGWLLYQLTAGIRITSTTPVAVDDERYSTAINDYFAAHPAERVRALLNNEELSRYLAQVTPEVVAAKATGSAGFATSQFALTFREPVVGWQIRDKQYFVDKNGVPFQINYFENPAVMIIDQSGVPESSGTIIASSRFLRFMASTLRLSGQYGLIVEKAVIPVNTTHEIDVYIKGYGYPIKLSLDRPVGEQVEDMQRAISYFATRQLTPQYIDIRVSGKAFYK